MLNFVFDNLQILFYKCLLLAYIILDISKNDSQFSEMLFVIEKFVY